MPRMQAWSSGTPALFCSRNIVLAFCAERFPPPHLCSPAFLLSSLEHDYNMTHSKLVKVIHPRSIEGPDTSSEDGEREEVRDSGDAEKVDTLGHDDGWEVEI